MNTNIIEMSHASEMAVDLDQALPINFNLRPVNPDLIALSKDLVESYFPKKLTAVRHRKALTVMGMLIANLYTCYLHWQSLGSVHGHIPWLSYSRNKQKYTIAQRYKHSDFSYDVVVRKIIDPLIQSGLIDEVPGYHHSASGAGRQGRLGFQGLELISIFSDVYTEFQSTGKVAVELLPSVETVILKDCDGRLSDYHDSPATVDMRKLLAELNSFHSSQSITVNGKLLQNMNMYRVFNNDSWAKGGRIYCSPQNLPKAIRAEIKINGSPVVELDYAGLHMNMAYAMYTGSTCDSYPYDDSDYGSELKKYKTLMKVATLVVFNCSNKIQAMGAVNNKIQNLGIELPNGMKGKQIVEMIQDKHEDISELFCSGCGLDLQYADSQLTVSILTQCKKDGVAAIPIHDSYIVQEKYRGYLQALMLKVFKDKYGCDIVID